MNHFNWANISLHKMNAVYLTKDDAFMRLLGEFKQQRQSEFSALGYQIGSAWWKKTELLFSKTSIPTPEMSSASTFERKLKSYADEVRGYQKRIDQKIRKGGFIFYDDLDTLLGFINDILDVVGEIEASRARIDERNAPKSIDHLALIQRLAERFHESVKVLSKHPHGGMTWEVKDEWDCQYLFHSILSAYFTDIRLEEWGPSVGGSAARCEFYLKDHRTLIELKFVRKSDDQKKIKEDLLIDMGNYGPNSDVDYVINLVYDPQMALPKPIPLMKDLSGERAGLKSIVTIVSPVPHNKPES